MLGPDVTTCPPPHATADPRPGAKRDRRLQRPQLRPVRVADRLEANLRFGSLIVEEFQDVHIFRAIWKIGLTAGRFHGRESNDGDESSDAVESEEALFG